MEMKELCQSCSMPLENAEMHGTEKDGSASAGYCKYCYQDGAFVDMSLTLEGMKSIVKIEMEKLQIAPGIIEKSLFILPYLNRWKK